MFPWTIGGSTAPYTTASESSYTAEETKRDAGLRIVDWSNPFDPKEVGYYISAGNSQRFCPPNNEVFVDRSTGLIYLADRWGLGLHILEFTG